MERQIFKILEKIARDFDLKLNKKDIEVLALPKKEVIILNYIFSLK